MGKRAANEPELRAILRELLHNAEKLAGLQVEVLKAEAGQEFRRAGDAASSLGAGAGLVALGGALTVPALVHLLHDRTGLPLWACYGLLAGGLSAAGALLLRSGGRSLSGLRLTFPQTTEALKENLSWLREQVTSGGA